MLYENLYIGTFIYTLGLISGQRGVVDHETILLLQQTPEDAVVGDLFARWQGTNLIIEFKRSKRQLEDEAKKVNRRQLLEELRQLGNEPLKEISDRCHFLAVPDENAGELSLMFNRYTDLPQMINGTNVPSATLTRFVEQILNERDMDDDKRTIGVGFEDLHAYMETMRKVAFATTSGSGGLIVNLDADGHPHIVHYDDLHILERSLSVEKRLERRPDLGMER